MRKRRRRRLKKQAYALLTALGLGAVLSVVLVFYAIKGIGAILFPPPEIKPSEDILHPISYPVMNMEKVTLLLDPGHGGFDGGNCEGENDEYQEKKINLAIALKVKEDLESINPNIEVLMTRDSDELDWEPTVEADLDAREEMQTSLGADIFLSLHCNSSENPDAKGYSFYYRSVDEPASELAEVLDSNFEEIGWSELLSYNPDEPLQVVTRARIPSMLLEMAFMTNEDDLELLLDDEQTDRLAMAIAGSLSDFIMENADEIREAHETLNAWVEEQDKEAAEAEKQAQEAYAQQQKEAAKAARLAEEQAEKEAQEAAKQEQSSSTKSSSSSSSNSSSSSSSSSSDDDS